MVGKKKREGDEVIEDISTVADALTDQVAQLRTFVTELQSERPEYNTTRGAPSK